MPTPLHNHSNYSRLDGLSTPKEIAKRVEELGFDAVGITDHDIVAGHIDFYNTMAEHNIKPILGIETYQAPTSRFIKEAQSDKATKQKLDNFHLILLAQNNEGLKNLWRINTESHRSGFHHHGRVDWDLLEQKNDGIICTSACALGLLSEYVRHDLNWEGILARYLEIFGDNFYIELSTYAAEFQREINNRLVEIASDWSVPLVYGNDAHYAFPEQYDLHEATLAIQYNQKLSERDGPYHDPCLFIMDEFDVRDSLCYLPDWAINDAISNTEIISSKCLTTLPEARSRVPVFITKKNSNWDALVDLVQEGYNEKIKENHDVYTERIKKEMEIIYNSSLYDYFLIVQDYIAWAKSKDIIVGPGRGSVGGSLVAYLIGVTEVDPIKYDLIFERFYNAGRTKSLPDIDTDISHTGRQLVKDYISKKYGSDHVADLGTNITLKSKGAINDLGRVFNIPLEDVREIGKILDKTVVAGIQADWDTIKAEVGLDLAPWYGKYPQIFEWAERLYAHIRAYGVHASGIIIGDEPLDGVYPLRWVPKEKKMVTQWTMDVAQEFGYMKMDLLGLRTLETLQEVNHILKTEGKSKIDYSNIKEEECPVEMWELLDKGLTVGLFQIEEGAAAKRIAREMKPRSVEDLGVILALNRPGPLDSGDVNVYLKRRNGENFAYEHELVKKATEKTYGVFIYQEQIIRFLESVGYIPNEADEFRAIMGKKKVKEVNAQRDRFIKFTAKATSNANLAAILWNKFVNFSKYGFNKSHAIAYGIVLLRTLYAKHYHPDCFLLACVKTVDKVNVKKYLDEAKRLEIPIFPPDINSSDLETRLINGGIGFGFSEIKFIGKGTAKWIIQNRPFVDKDDLLVKAKEDERKVTLPSGVRKMAINSRQINILEQVGAFDSISPRQLSEDEKVDIEMEYLGIAFSDNSAMILEQHKDEIDKICYPIAKLKSSFEIGAYNIAGVISDITLRTTKQGKPYARIKILGDEEIEVFVWSEVLAKYSFALKRRSAAIFMIDVKSKGMNLKHMKLLFEKNDQNDLH